MSWPQLPADARQAQSEQDRVQPRMQASASEILGSTVWSLGAISHCATLASYLDCTYLEYTARLPRGCL